MPLGSGNTTREPGLAVENIANLRASPEVVAPRQGQERHLPVEPVELLALAFGDGGGLLGGFRLPLGLGLDLGFVLVVDLGV